MRATQSKNIVRWSTGGRATIGHLAYIPEEGKYFFVQFFIDSPAGRPAGELATAFKPSADQVRRIEDKLKNCGNKRL